MSSDPGSDLGPAIRARGLSKRYRLGGSVWRSSGTLRDVIAGAAGAPLRRIRNAIRRDGGSDGAKPPEFIWSLRDVSFDVDPGEVVGVVGRNGAGKTTLLKVLSRITEPTEGFAEVRGRVGALLEVGTGFHPELTGRENIYLNGAILGMRKAEIDRLYDEIVEFSGVERFLDTPIKRYSSGMLVRLGFSVAAHLEPEILLVDEVLAVGDVAFQKKCLGKMDEVAGGGRTVIFVSHNLAMVQALCRRGIYIEEGRVKADGTVEEAVEAYLASLEQTASVDLRERIDRLGEQQVRVVRVEVEGPGENSRRLVSGKPASFSFWLDGDRPGTTCAFTIHNQVGQPVTRLSTALRGPEDSEASASGNVWTCSVDELLLLPGRYRIDVRIKADRKMQDRVEGAAFFDVEPGTLRGRPMVGKSKHGHVVLPHRWVVPPDR